MSTIGLKDLVGDFAEDKDMARKIRIESIIPELKNGEKIILDFSGVNLVTQSFIHALISDLIRHYGIDIVDEISFKECNKTIRTIINVVIDYMQDIVADEV